MKRARYAKGAQADFLAIVKFIGRDRESWRAARRLVAGLRAKARRLAENPMRQGSLREEFGAGVRFVVRKGYVIYFVYVSDGVRVLRVLAGRQDRSALDRD